VEVITNSGEVEEEDCETCPDGEMMESDDEEENMVFETPCPEDVVTDEKEEGMKSMTPRIETSCNDANCTPKEIKSTQYVQHKDRQYC
jgi:hypothetical protein